MALSYIDKGKKNLNLKADAFLSLFVSWAIAMLEEFSAAHTIHYTVWKVTDI